MYRYTKTLYKSQTTYCICTNMIILQRQKTESWKCRIRILRTIICEQKNRKVNQQKSFFRRKNATGENPRKRYTNPRQHTVFVRKPSGDREKLRKTLEDMMTKMLMVFYMVSLWKCWAKTLSWGSPQEPLFSCLPRDKPHPQIIINNSSAALAKKSGNLVEIWWKPGGN